MSKLNKVLIVTTSQSVTDSFVPRALALARKLSSSSAFFSVVEEPSPEELTALTLIPPDKLLARLVEEQQSTLEGCAERYRQREEQIDTFVTCGKSFIETIKKVKKDGCDMVMLGAEPSAPYATPIFNSTIMHLLRKCPCPVWVLDSRRHKPINCVVAAVDVFAPTPEGLALNHRILQWSAGVAKRENARLHVVHAWQLLGGGINVSKIFGSETEQCVVAVKEQREREKAMDALVAESLVDFELAATKVIEGNPAAVIPSYAELQDAGLVVLGTVCRANIPGCFIGSTAESILDNLHCSVLALKPEGFVSPVE